MLRIYRKDIELEAVALKYRAYAQAVGIALGEDEKNRPHGIPPTWRVEWEIRGAALTELECRELPTIAAWLPALVGRLAGCDKNNAIGIDHTGWRILSPEGKSIEDLHPLWTEIVAEVGRLRAPDPDYRIERKAHERHLDSALRDAFLAAVKANERLQALVTVAEQIPGAVENLRQVYKPRPRPEEIARRVDAAVAYYGLTDVADKRKKEKAAANIDAQKRERERRIALRAEVTAMKRAEKERKKAAAVNDVHQGNSPG